MNASETERVRRLFRLEAETGRPNDALPRAWPWLLLGLAAGFLVGLVSPF